jgi:hypothetical protein
MADPTIPSTTTFSSVDYNKTFHLCDLTASQATGALSTGIGLPPNARPTSPVTGDTLANERIGGEDFNATVWAGPTGP